MKSVLMPDSNSGQCNSPNSSHLLQIGYGAVDSGTCLDNSNVLTVDTTGNVVATGTITAPALAAKTVSGDIVTGNVISGKTFEVTNSGSATTFSGSGNQGTLGGVA